MNSRARFFEHLNRLFDLPLFRRQATFAEELPIATKTTKTMEERSEALKLRSLSKRSNITLCIHGINKSYCKPCNTKKVKPAKSAKIAATE